jgi:hypothetical protein
MQQTVVVLQTSDLISFAIEYLSSYDSVRSSMVDGRRLCLLIEFGMFNKSIGCASSMIAIDDERRSSLTVGRSTLSISIIGDGILFVRKVRQINNYHTQQLEI